MAEVGIVILLFAKVYGNSADSFGLDFKSSGKIGQAINIQTRIILISCSVVVSFILLFVDWRKSFLIIKSRDISYAFTSTVSYRYYVIRSYAHYCFFSKINNSKKTKDTCAVWVYFQLKKWKRLLLAEMIRQILNAINLIDIIEAAKAAAKIDSSQGALQSYILTIKYLIETSGNGLLALYALSTVTVLIWLVSFVALLAAAITYIFLLFSIRGNLKEYCVHKIDKR